MAKVSVIVPIYGVEKYIEQCAISLFEQSLDDIEYLFVNDSTKDNSIVVLNEVIKRYPNRERQTHVLNHEHNKGLPIARQTGIREASGEYIYHCDSDDWLELNMLQTLYEKALAENADIVYCDFYFANNLEDKVWHKESLSNNYCVDLLKDKVSPNVWNKLCRRRLYTENLIFFPSGNMGEDLALMSQISYYSKRTVHVSKPLYYYRQNQYSMTGIKDKESIIRKFENLTLNYRTLLLFADEIKEPSIRDRITARILRMKSILYPYLEDKSIYNLWRNTYKEYHVKWIFSPYVSIKDKMRYVHHYYFG